MLFLRVWVAIVAVMKGAAKFENGRVVRILCVAAASAVGCTCPRQQCYKCMLSLSCGVVEGDFEYGIYGDGVNASGFCPNRLACMLSKLAVTIEAVTVDVAVLM